MQADGLVMEIVKRFTERLHQIKDIMELRGALRDLTGPAPCGSHITLSY